MANKSFGIKELNLIGSSGAPVIESPTSLSIYATTVAISTDVSIGGKVTSNVIIGNEYSVGIGTTNPTSKLTVQGDASFTGVVTATAFVGDGSGLTNLPGGGGGTNYWSQTAAGINTLSNVGIGTTNPTSKLQVNGTIKVTNGDVEIPNGYAVVINGQNAITVSSLGPTITSSSLTTVGTLQHLGVSGNVNVTGITTTARLSVGTGGTVITTTSGGLVGIGTTNPTSKLTVQGDASFTGVVTAPTFDGSLKGDIVGITTLGFFSDEQILHDSVELGDNTRYYSVHKNITVDSGSTFTVGTGSTVLLDRFNNLDDVTAKSITSPFIMSYNSVFENFTVPTNYNAMSVGPTLSISNGIVVTVQSGASWSIVP